LIPIIQSNSAEIIETRYYSESDKTRIVFQLDEIAQYKAEYDQDRNINITISKTNLGKSSKILDVDDGLIKTLSLKETDDNSVDIKISLVKPARYTIFTLESPARIVADLTPVGNIITPKVVTITPNKVDTKPNNENKQVNNPVNTNKPPNSSIITPKPVITNTKSSPEMQSNLSILGLEWLPVSEFFDGNISAIFQYTFDLIVLAIIIFLVLRVRTADKLVRYIKKNRRMLKNNPVFADMLIEIGNGRKQNPEKKVNKKPEKIEEKITKDEKIINDEKVTKQYDKVQELARQGIDPITISQRSNIPVGEVNLILDLMKARREGPANS
jgi:hypothetical protein